MPLAMALSAATFGMSFPRKLPANRELYLTELSGLQARIWREHPKSLPWAPARKTRIDCPNGRHRSPDQRTGIHGVRTVLRAETHGGGQFRPRPGARRNIGLPRAA